MGAKKVDAEYVVPNLPPEVFDSCRAGHPWRGIEGEMAALLTRAWSWPLGRQLDLRELASLVFSGIGHRSTSTVSIRVARPPEGTSFWKGWREQVITRHPAAGKALDRGIAHTAAGTGKEERTTHVRRV